MAEELRAAISPQNREQFTEHVLTAQRHMLNFVVSLSEREREVTAAETQWAELRQEIARLRVQNTELAQVMYNR